MSDIDVRNVCIKNSTKSEMCGEHGRTSGDLREIPLT